MGADSCWGWLHEGFGVSEQSTWKQEKAGAEAGHGAPPVLTRDGETRVGKLGPRVRAGTVFLVRPGPERLPGQPHSSPRPYTAVLPSQHI